MADEARRAPFAGLKDPIDGDHRVFGYRKRKINSHFKFTTEIHSLGVKPEGNSRIGTLLLAENTKLWQPASQLFFSFTKTGDY